MTSNLDFEKASSDKDFFEVNKKEGFVMVKVNKQIFPIDLIYNAAYMILDRAYVILDSSPGYIVYVLLRPRTFKGELEELGRIFYDELVSTAFQTVQFVRNQGMREVLMRSLVEEETDEADINEKDIATLWEDKFGESREAGKKKQ